MKKLINFVLLTLVIFSISSCNSDDESLNRINTTPLETTIVGEWEFGDVIQPCGQKNSVEFLSNYGFVENHQTGDCSIVEYEDNYTLVDNKITFFGSTKTILELSSTRLALEYPNGDVVVFNRK